MELEAPLGAPGEVEAGVPGAGVEETQADADAPPKPVRGELIGGVPGDADVAQGRQLEAEPERPLVEDVVAPPCAP